MIDIIKKILLVDLDNEIKDQISKSKKIPRIFLFYPLGRLALFLSSFGIIILFLFFTQEKTRVLFQFLDPTALKDFIILVLMFYAVVTVLSWSLIRKII